MPEIKKVVIPAAGLGTRFLPATKVVPKELLPIATRPAIQYAVEEAVASGIETVILVIGPGKELVPRHFSHNPDLEETLARRGWKTELAEIQRLAEFVDIKVAWQDRPLGLAHAIKVAEPFVASETFAVILPDAVIDSVIPCTRQLINCYRDYPGCIVATQAVRADETERFGIVEIEAVSPPNSRVSLISSLRERPTPGETKSRLGIFGRYLLTPDIFPFIASLSPGRGGEFQLTDALSLCRESVPVYAYHFEGEHFDVGSKVGFVQATIRYALKDPVLAESVTQYLAGLSLDH